MIDLTFYQNLTFHLAYDFFSSDFLLNFEHFFLCQCLVCRSLSRAFPSSSLLQVSLLSSPGRWQIQHTRQITMYDSTSFYSCPHYQQYPKSNSLSVWAFPTTSKSKGVQSPAWASIAITQTSRLAEFEFYQTSIYLAYQPINNLLNKYHRLQTKINNSCHIQLLSISYKYLITQTNFIRLNQFQYYQQYDYIKFIVRYHMGSQPAQPITKNPKEIIRAATLNYCGIMNSPFEFYCPDFQKQLDQISNIFVALIPQYIKDFKQEWNVGKIDVKITKGRYSPMFTYKAGIKLGAFLSKQQFQVEWERIFQAQVQKLKNFQFKEQQKKTAMLFDTLIYHTLLKYVYNVQSIDDARDKDPTKEYLTKIQPFFELSFLDQQLKLQKLKQGFNKIGADIFIFQEYSQYFYQYLQQQGKYHMSVDSQKDVLVIAKKQVFPISQKLKGKQSKIIKQIISECKFPSTPATLLVDHYIIIGLHLSSKAQKNKPQIQALKQSLINLKQSLLENNLNYEVIVGGDLNSYFSHFSNHYQIYPQFQNQPTTLKERTMTQCQYKKGRKLIQQSKDKIISTLRILNGSIKYINNQIPEKRSLVPNHSHPFDHFVVVTQLQK